MLANPRIFPLIRLIRLIRRSRNIFGFSKTPKVTVMIILLIYILEFSFSVLANQRCPDDVVTSVPKYNLIERCHRSKLGIAAKANYSSLVSCQRLAIKKRGLSINFSPPGVKKHGVEYSCEVLKCAETESGLSLGNDTAFDYYSLYGRPLPKINSTCVPTIGMFHLLPEHMNYTESQVKCKNLSSIVPDITSEQRTDALAQVLAGASVDAVFVGLRRMNSSDFIGDNGDSLDCTTYRAWAPGHPRKNFSKYDCMLITRRKTWISAPCKKRFPVFCELIPGGPYKKGSIFVTQEPYENDTTSQPNKGSNARKIII